MTQHRAEIEQSLVIGRAKWSKLLARVQDVETLPESDFNDEQIWTFLLACGYAIAGPTGVRRLNEQCGTWSKDHRIWFEVLPLPPRPLEGNTNLDLAIGAIARRGDTRSGIRFAPDLGTQVCFFEFKWYSDISISTSRDLHRNQLARVIDTAITFGAKQKEMPDQVQVTLVTPGVFKNQYSPSRLYGYKWAEYSSSTALLADLESFSEGVIVDHDYEALLGKLTLEWFSFEDLMASMPLSPIRDEFIRFASAHGPILELQGGAT